MLKNKSVVKFAVISVIVLAVTGCNKVTVSGNDNPQSVANISKMADCIKGAVVAYGRGEQDYKQGGCLLSTSLSETDVNGNSEPTVFMNSRTTAQKKTVKLIVYLPAAQLKANNVAPVIANIDNYVAAYKITVEQEQKKQDEAGANPLNKSNTPPPCERTGYVVNNDVNQQSTFTCDGVRGVKLMIFESISR